MLLPYSNLQVKHQNPGATKPLILPIHVICNTSDEALYGNISINSRRPGKWLDKSPAHARVAVLCGSGPSLADHLDAVRRWRANGAAIFAMNGAASYLAANGIMPDYQVILDAREETADLVGPAHHHLFASQVHPACFDKMPMAQLWHLQIEHMDDYTPDYDEPFVEIGGAASVGNTAACLVYAMGYRNLQLYGYDSSHRADKSHAFHQPLNNGDPCAWVTFCGKQYLVSLTMKLQAEKFQETARDLKQLGCTIAVHGDGLLPDMYNTPKETMTEQEKYERMWAISEYRTLSPGEDAVPAFLKQVTERGTLLDIGCGTGRAGLKLKEAGFDVTLMDFTDNSRDYHALTLPFVRHDLTQSFPLAATYGYCCDVMEHIAPDQIVRVLLNILWATDRTFFQISTEPDRFGAVINQDLHLTVMPGSWWLDTIRVLGVTVDWFEETAGDIQCLVTTRRTHAAR